MTIKRIQGMPDKRLDEVIKSVLKTYLRESERKDLQLSLILNSNPPDDKNMPGHAWIRSTGDIHKWEETLEDFGYGDLTPDFRKKDVEKAIEKEIVKAPEKAKTPEKTEKPESSGTGEQVNEKE